AFRHVQSGGTEVRLANLDVRLPNGSALLHAQGISAHPGERVLVTGPSGAGKTTLLRAIAGIWPFGEGEIALPEQARLMILPQRPYIPAGRLDAALSYPAEPEAYERAQFEDVLTAVGLPALVLRLEEAAAWPHVLSLGEQQRLSIARVLLVRPDVLLLDEATAALDEPLEARLYALIAQRLPKVVLLSIGHRSTLVALHDTALALEGAQSPRTLAASRLAPAAA
ncbi:MAG TPA: ATP-binding cassette domain-containing protein, partial [Xanthobacteraceae bacterium]|nr:ATP-binding cassette domain-containing protein [Xanthobacteraceae bacterium]